MRHNARQSDNNNLLLTKCKGRTGEYWPEVVLSFNSFLTYKPNPFVTNKSSDLLVLQAAI